MNVQIDHEAKGDGITDDTIALQQAIAATQEGNAIYFPSGTYIVSQKLEPKAGQVFFSLAGQAIIKAQTGVPAFNMFFIEHGAVQFHNLVIDLAGVGSSGIVVETPLGEAVDVVVSGCSIQNANQYGIAVKSEALNSDRRLLVMNTIVEDCQLHGIRLHTVGRAELRSSSFNRNSNGVWAGWCKDINVQNVTANDNRNHGIVFVFSQGWHVNHCRADGNGDGTNGWGITAGGFLIEPPPPPNSDFTITNNICDGNASGGITLDPSIAQETEVIQTQRARLSGNICRNAIVSHGINLTHSRDVVITDNICTGNIGTGIQVSSSSHVLVQGNICSGNATGIGLSANAEVIDPGHHIIGVNMLYDNVLDFRGGTLEPQSGIRTFGLVGTSLPEGEIRANPGTLYQWHTGNDGALFLKESGEDNTTGWSQVVVQ